MIEASHGGDMLGFSDPSETLKAPHSRWCRGAADPPPDNGGNKKEKAPWPIGMRR